MRLELEDIRLRVARTEDERRDYVTMAKQWEKMWTLDAGFTQTARESVLVEGREQVITPDPYNVVQLAMRLISSQPKIDCPPAKEKDEARRAAEQKERWLSAMYQRVNWQQGRNLVDDLKWQALVRGRCVVEAKWVKDDLPVGMQKKAFPILVRTLDPLEVGVKRGPLYVEWAYHKYEAEKIDVRQRYPHLKKWEKPKPTGKKRIESESDFVTVTDFWYVSPVSGTVWNAILVDDEFAKEPTETDYPYVPIIEGRGDSAPTKNKAYEALSLLHPLNGLWQYKCRLESNLGTGVLWYTWPFFLVTHPMGAQLDDITVRPGATVQAPEGTQVQEVRPQANVGIIEQMLAKVDTAIQQATFPNVLFGDAGQMQAGYGVNILADSARGRVNSVRESIEMTLQSLNELVLGLIDAFDEEDDGVELWGRDAGDEKLYKLTLKKEQIDGYYENSVTLKPNVPQDDMAKQTLGIRLVDSGIISPQTYRDKYLSITVPSEEDDRVLAAQAKKHPDIMKKETILMYMRQNPKTWEAILKGTEFEQMAYQMAFDALGIPNPQEQPQPAQMAMPPMPPPMPMMPPGGPPMPPQGPPPPIQPPPVLTGPMGGGIPPELQQMMGGGEAMGLDPQMNPALFAQMTGQQMGPGDELRALLPPGVA